MTGHRLPSFCPKAKPLPFPLPYYCLLLIILSKTARAQRRRVPPFWGGIEKIIPVCIAVNGLLGFFFVSPLFSAGSEELDDGN